MKQFFITGTDTEVGKTHISCLLLKFIQNYGHRALGFKPIAAGAEEAFGQWVNDDALSLLESSNVNVPYNTVNPFVFAEPIAPHIAAKNTGKTITLASLSASYRAIKASDADYLLTEGAGGWALPINDTDYLYDWVKAENLPVILVVGLKLGCLNHALLTQAHMLQLGINCVGWIANHVDNTMLEQQANIASLKERLTMPLLAIAPYAGEQAKLQVHDVLLDVLKLR